MQFFLLLISLLNATYFTEWIPNNATAAPPPPDPPKGEFPWQLSI